MQRFFRSKDRERSKILSVSLLTGGASLLALLVVYKVLSRTDGILYIWPASAIQLAFLMRHWSDRRIRIRGQAAGIFGVFLGARIVGIPGWFAACVAVVTAVDVSIAGAILGRAITQFDDLKRSSSLLRLVGASTVAPALSSALNALPLSLFLHESLLRAYLLSLMCDSLGIAIVFPAALLLLAGEKRKMAKLTPLLRKGWLPAILFPAIAGGVFWQNNNPLLFLVFPPIVLMVLMTGLEGAVYVSAVLALIACYATDHHHGPLWLSRSLNLEHQVLLLQVYLWMCAATALPIGSLLDERRRAEENAADARFVYRTLLQHADDMIILSSLDGSQRYVSAACERLTGWTSEEYMVLDRMSIVHPDDRHISAEIMRLMKAGRPEQVFRYRIAQKAGGWRWVEVSSRVYTDDKTGEVKGYVGTVRDISRHVETEAEWHEERTTLDRDKQEMARLARTDVLTGLPNRLHFDEALFEQAALLRHNTGKLTVMMIDVDDFKKYNDTYGHQAGDECLRSIAAALAACAMREKDIVARWGGEEFVMLLPGSDLAGAERTADRILETIRGLAVRHSSRPSGFVTVSIGGAELRGPSSMNPAQLLHQADGALYKSKHTGKDRFTAAAPSVMANKLDPGLLQFSGS